MAARPVVEVAKVAVVAAAKEAATETVATKEAVEEVAMAVGVVVMVGEVMEAAVTAVGCKP